MPKFIKTIDDRIRFAIKKGLTGYISPEKLMEEVHAESMNRWKKDVEEFERTTKLNLYLAPFEKIETIAGLTAGDNEGSKAISDSILCPVSVLGTGNIKIPILSVEEYDFRLNHQAKFPDIAHPTDVNHTTFEEIESVAVLGGSPQEGSATTIRAHRYPRAAMSAVGNIEVLILTVEEYNYRFRHPTKFPDAGHPICKFVNNVIYVAPRMDVKINHLVKPICKFVGNKIFVSPIMDVAVMYLKKPIKPYYATALVGDAYVYDDANSIDIEWDEVVHDEIMNRVLANLGINMREGDLVRFSQGEKQMEGK